jgi:hypothetical protein
VTTSDPDPAVLSWHLSIAAYRHAFPRPTRRHWWRDLVTDTYRAARDAREALRESGHLVDVAGGAGADVAAYQVSDQEFAAAHPPVLLADVMRALSHGRPA